MGFDFGGARGEIIDMKSLAFILAGTLASAVAVGAQTAPVEGAAEQETDESLTIETTKPVVEELPEKPNEIRIDGVKYEGILVQVAKTDNPAQLINPFAPERYGDGFENVVTAPSTEAPEEEEPRGLKLFSISFW